MRLIGSTRTKIITVDHLWSHKVYMIFGRIKRDSFINSKKPKIFNLIKRKI